MHYNIPKTIYQTWKTKKLHEILDPQHQQCIKSIKRHNSHYQHIIYDDSDCDRFIKDHFPEYYNIYVNLKIPVQKADFWRYLVIYKYGGIYMDMDCICTRNFDTFNVTTQNLNPLNILIAEEELIRYDKGVLYQQYAQYWFASSPKHPVLLLCIENVISAFKNPEILTYKKDEQTIYLTGPIPWSNAIHNYSNRCEIYINKRSSFDYILSSALVTYGNYPIHHIAKGTWRDEKDSIPMAGLVVITIISMLILILIIFFILEYSLS
jgi:mannosyltransferase OCH1-like enzyme